MFKSKQFIIGLVISLVFLVWALSREDLGSVGRTILQMNWVALIPALVLYFIGVWIRAIRWRILLQPLRIKMTLRQTFDVVVIGYMANNVLPARIGELVRAYVVEKREGVRKTSTLATIVVERIFDGLIMIGFVAAALLFVILFHRELLGTGTGHTLGTLISNYSIIIGIGALGFLAFLVFFIAVASSRSRVERLVAFGLRLAPGKLHDRLNRLAIAFIDGLGSLRSGSTLALVFGLSIAAWLFEASMYYVIGNLGFGLAGSDGAPVPFYAYMLATGFVNLSTLLPQAPGYLGIFEVVAQGVLVGGIGVNGQHATSYVLLLHAALLIPITLLGVVLLARESLSWGELTRLERTRAAASERAHEMEAPWTDVELAEENRLPDTAQTGSPTAKGRD